MRKQLIGSLSTLRKGAKAVMPGEPGNGQTFDSDELSKEVCQYLLGTERDQPIESCPPELQKSPPRLSRAFPAKDRVERRI